MKLLKKGVILIICASLAPWTLANDDNRLANTVNSFTIESYNFVLNLNLLNELCSMESYLDVNLDSKAFNDRLSANIVKFAEIGNIDKYNAEEVAKRVKIKFVSFLQGVRYGGFIADNFIKVNYPKGVCTDDIRKEVQEKVAELVKTDEFMFAKDE